MLHYRGIPVRDGGRISSGQVVLSTPANSLLSVPMFLEAAMDLVGHHPSTLPLVYTWIYMHTYVPSIDMIMNWQHCGG